MLHSPHTSTTMDSNGTEMIDTANEKSDISDQEQKPNIPLRQRRLPASFWQEPCSPPPQSPVSRDITHPAVLQAPLHQFPVSQMQPWSMYTSTIPLYVPQRSVIPNHFLMQQNSNPQWITSSPSCCTCPTCSNYSYVSRLPDLQSGLRYRPSINVPCYPILNCTEQDCKLCSISDRWHPERLRHFRLRAARYNGLLD